MTIFMGKIAVIRSSIICPDPILNHEMEIGKIHNK